MSLLFESIACKGGHLQNLSFHEERLNRSRAKLLGLSKPILLSDIEIPEFVDQGLWKCRVSYDRDIETVVFSKYESSRPTSYRLVEADIEYQHKFEDRDELNNLYLKRHKADDIIIVVNDQITDTSNANLLFNDGRQWSSPASPLLPGTMRAQLIESGLVIEQVIAKGDIGKYEKFMAINALNPFDIKRALPVSQIQY